MLNVSALAECQCQLIQTKMSEEDETKKQNETVDMSNVSVKGWNSFSLQALLLLRIF